jgi:hypothetical protein
MRCSGRILMKSLQMGRKTALFVDIDGVISLWGFAPTTPPDGVWTQVDGITHFLSAEAAETLRGLTDVFAPVWATGWEEKANEYLPHALGLGPWPYLDLDGHGRGPGTSTRAHWKLEPVEHHAAGAPLAWIDDAVNDAVREWAAARPAPTLLIETDPAIGLTAAHGARLRRFAAEAAAAAA